jgi:ribonuclease HII
MRGKIEIGIDEAGRGAVIGPMVVAGIQFDERGLYYLTKIGVKDSKKLSPSMREKLYAEIIEMAQCHEARIYSATEIDRNSLTTLTLEGISQIIDLFGMPAHGRIVLDSIGKLARDKVEQVLRIRDGVDFVYEPKADDCYPVCQAASIVAKVIRDREVKKIHKRVGFDFGKGYPTRSTTDFIRKYTLDNGQLPPETRTRWGNIRQML